MSKLTVSLLLVLLLGALIAGVAAWNLRAPEPGLVTRFSFVYPEGQVIGRAGQSFTVAVADDGQRFAYAANGGIYLGDFSETGSRLIPGTDQNIAYRPVFSPDGQWIAFSTRDELMKVAVTGAAPVPISQLETDSFGLSWTPDNTILFGQPEGVMGVSADGGEPRLLIAVEEGEVVDRPQMLPDGKSVLFTVINSVGTPGGAQAQVVVQSLDAKVRKVLVEGGHSAQYVPTGHIVYALGDGLFGIRFDPETVAVVGVAATLVQGIRTGIFPSTMSGADYAFSDRGTLLYVPNLAETRDRVLALVDRQGGVEHLVDVPLNQYVSPRISPDGSRVAVQTIDAEGGSTIWVYSLSGDTAIRPLTQGGDNVRPIWTPNSEYVTFASNREGAWGIYRQRAAGGDVAELLTMLEENLEPRLDSWSPDGSTLVFTRFVESSTAASLWTLSVADGSEPEPLTDTIDGRDASFSQNGQWMAYHADVDGAGYRVYVMPFPPTGVEPYRVSENDGVFPLWSDTNELFYRRSINEANRQFTKIDVVMDAEISWGTEQPLPIEGFSKVNSYRNYDIMPDGDRFVMVFPAKQAEADEPARQQINIILNWFEELKAKVPVP